MVSMSATKNVAQNVMQNNAVQLGMFAQDRVVITKEGDKRYCAVIDSWWVGFGDTSDEAVKSAQKKRIAELEHWN